MLSSIVAIVCFVTSNVYGVVHLEFGSHRYDTNGCAGPLICSGF
jgi:hypothetical protein